MKIKLKRGPISLPCYIVAVSDSKVVGMYKSECGLLSVSMTKRILKSLHEAAV